ncbi:hypothetical protein [Sphingobacterium paludis]|uniref:Uncharacterized protein n=1 Tax=Sphingobacterium paludis TaxID=1476465 RepID=A0A4R7CSS4_9SPHI|nr:hypothetical protein [Sphingobacterium paludis]TDS08877.1 hypothetical protein B0I21_1116 [Sphingobacterium paludis]
MRSANTNQAITNNFSIQIPFKPFFVKEEFRLDPEIPSAPRHELHLTFFADARARIPIQLPVATPIFINQVIRHERDGSNRTGFTMVPVTAPKPFYNTVPSHTMVRKPVLLINNLSIPADGSYKKGL